MNSKMFFFDLKEMRASRVTWVKREIEEYLAQPELRVKKVPKAQKAVKDLEERVS